jgi:iron complex outermembrane receptor protein
MSALRFRRGESAERASSWFVVCCLLLAVDVEFARADDPAPPPPALPARSVGQVTATATRSERDVLDVAGNVTVLDREQIERSGATTVPELLSREPGIMVTNTTTSPEGYTVEARGFNDGGGNGSSTLVLVDGRRINEAESSTPDWSWLRLDDVERIEIVRGPASAVWGDNAVGGVINIITRKGAQGTQLNAIGRFGSWGTWHGSNFIGVREGPIEASFFADVGTSDGYRQRSGFDDHRYEGSVRGMLAEQIRVGLTAGYASDHGDRPGALSQEQIAVLGRRAADPGTEGDEQQRRRYHVDGLVEWAPLEDLHFEFVPFTSERTDDAVLTIPAGDFLGRSRSTDDRHIQSVGINAQARFERPIFGMASRFTAGADWLNEEISVDSEFSDLDGGVVLFAGSTRSRRRTVGGYLQEELNLTPDLLLSAGLRYEDGQLHGRDPAIPGSSFDNDDAIWSPKASLSYRVMEPVAVYAAYSHGFRFPNIDEAFGLFGFFPQLATETSNAYEIGGKLRTSCASANLAFYWMDVEDQILFDHEIDGVFGPSPMNVNIDRVRHRGIEFGFVVDPLPWLELHGNYTLDDTQIQHDSISDLDGKRLPITPLHRGNAGARVKLPFQVELAAQTRVIGSRYVANDLRNEFQKLSAFAVYDAGVSWRPLIGARVELAIQFWARNLFDRKYTEVAGERTFSRGEIGYYPSPTRSFEGSVGVTLRR